MHTKFCEISQYTAELLLLPVCENGCPPYEISASGFDFNYSLSRAWHFVSACQISSKSWTHGRVMTSYRLLRKSGSRNTMMTSDFRSEVKIRPFRACAMKNVQYNPYLWPNCRNFRVIKAIGVEEHDGVVRFKSGSGNVVLSCMLNAFGHNYKNSSFIANLAMGQIPRSTERISCLPQNYRFWENEGQNVKFCYSDAQKAHHCAVWCGELSYHWY